MPSDLGLIVVILIVSGFILLMFSGAGYVTSYLLNKSSTSEVVEHRSFHTYLISPLTQDLSLDLNTKYVHLDLTSRSRGKVIIEVADHRNRTIYNFTSDGYLSENLTLPGSNRYKLIVYDVPDVSPEVIDLSINITYKIEEKLPLQPSMLNLYKIMLYPGLGLITIGATVSILSRLFGSKLK